MKKKNQQIQSINCQQAVERFNDFMDNYLKGKKRNELLKHFTECKNCMDRFEFEQLLKSKVHLLSSAVDSETKGKIENLMASL
jgi:transcription elongation factor Elf1